MTTLDQLASPVIATRNVLTASSLISEALNGTNRVHAGEIPQAVIGALAGMPPLCIEIATAGSSARTAGGGDGGHVPIGVHRVDVRCYGRTRTEADLAALAVRYTLKEWVSGRTTGNELVHCFHRTSGPIPLTRQDTGWPMSVITFQVQMADELIPV